MRVYVYASVAAIVVKNNTKKKNKNKLIGWIKSGNQQVMKESERARRWVPREERYELISLLGGLSCVRRDHRRCIIIILFVYRFEWSSRRSTGNHAMGFKKPPNFNVSTGRMYLCSRWGSEIFYRKIIENSRDGIFKLSLHKLGLAYKSMKVDVRGVKLNHYYGCICGFDK